MPRSYRLDQVLARDYRQKPDESFWQYKARLIGNYELWLMLDEWAESGIIMPQAIYTLWLVKKQALEMSYEELYDMVDIGVAPECNEDIRPYAEILHHREKDILYERVHKRD
jgi:hypothetical protein